MLEVYQCIMCPQLVRIESIEQDVWLRMVKGKWQIICDSCAMLLMAEGWPVMRIRFGSLKEESHAKRS